MEKTFRVLSLSGGGIRGVFQAEYLARMSESVETPLRNHFELIAGTSTGALLALAVALDIDLHRVVDFYKTHGPQIFKPRTLAGLRKGARYDSKPLVEAVNEIFKNKRLSDCQPVVLVTASSLDRFKYRMFSTMPGFDESDRELSAAEVALASAAAPTYFPPVKPAGQNRTYVDGGLWANSPTLAAVITSHQQLKIPFSSMRVLAVGNGEFPKGIRPDDFRKCRPIGFRSTTTIFDLMFSCQESFADDYVSRLLSPDSFVKVNVSLDENLPLDAVAAALEKLPPLAEQEFENTQQRAFDITAPTSLPAASTPQSIGLVSKELLEAAGLSGFYPSRAHYSHRGDAASIDRYIATARSRLVMVSINLMTGVAFDGMLEVLKAKLMAGGFSATISLLNPTKKSLMDSVAPVLDMRSEELAHATVTQCKNLIEWRRSLGVSSKRNMRLRLHNAVPFGSAILIDHDTPTGRIQVETKAYRTPVRKSFAFEVMKTLNSGDLYTTLSESYEHLIEDGCEMDSIPVS